MGVFTLSPILMQSLIFFCHNLWAECALQERNFFTIYLHRTFSKFMFRKLGFPKAPFPEIMHAMFLTKQDVKDRGKVFGLKNLIFFKLCQNSLPLLHMKSSDVLTLQPAINLCFCCLSSHKVFHSQAQNMEDYPF